MSLLNYFFGSKQKTAAVAKERLSLIIAHERTSARSPGFRVKLLTSFPEESCIFPAVMGIPNSPTLRQR